MLCLSVTKEQEIPSSDLVELRLDLFPKIDFNWVREVVKKHSVLITVRAVEEGGGFKGSLEERMTVLKKCACLNPEYIDLEASLSQDFVKEVSCFTKVIISYHNFVETPLDLEEEFKKLTQHKAHYYKFITTAHSSIDALRLLLFLKEKKGVIAFAMGEEGTFSRILASVLGSPISYCCLEKPLASGQLSRSEFLNYQTFKDAKIFALIGDPLDKSPSHITHNALFKELSIPAVYVKIPMSKKEVSLGVSLLKEIGVCGCSVTMPLKQEVKGHQLISCNTIGEGERYCNTDTPAIIELLEERFVLKGKKGVILGAGAVSQDLVSVLIKKEVQVVVANRSLKEGFKTVPLDQIPLDYDFLINTTPLSLPISKDSIVVGKVVMDINNKPLFSELLEEAKLKQCVLIFGYQLFIKQALKQFTFWFGDQFPVKRGQEILEKSLSFLET